ncbi:MAG: hypothetical protein FVQ82_14345 [Planctomycetes bacterium]|nr:hypothetical protein [Planctomycetota bacterium]
MRACFLTEYGDASGLDEMKVALKHFEENPNTNGELRFPFSRGKLIASFERITGKSFGRIPMTPSLHSSTIGAAEAEKQLEDLIKAWAYWWAWEPG